MAGIRMLVVWCPDWPVVASGAPGDAPVAVVAANRVVACSAAARAEGVRRGLRRRQAEACCPGLEVVAEDLGGEARAFEPVVAAVESFSPRVEIVRPGVCAVATRGPSRYFGGDAALASQVGDRVDEVLRGIACAPPSRIGVADGRFAAELAAGQAASTAGPPVVVPSGQSATFLARFPVSTLERDDLTDLLVRLGIRTLGDLAALPPGAVLARFGPEGSVAHRLARGLDERPLAARAPPPDLAVTAELDPPVEQLETVAFVARTLAGRLSDELAGRGLALAAVRVEAETEHGEALSRCWRLDHRGGTSATSASLAERVRWQLDGWLAGPTRPSGPLILLRLVPEEVRPDRGHQVGFWGGDRAAAERAARALERVQGRLGPEAVATAVLVGGRSPAGQVRLVPWGDPPMSDPVAAPWPGRLPLPAPATVPPRPVPAQVVDAAGRPVTVTGRGAVSAPPARVSADGRPWSEVVGWAGPWPVDERWWDAAAHRRLARCQVLTAEGTAYLLCLEGGRWHIEATYD